MATDDLDLHRATTRGSSARCGWTRLPADYPDYGTGYYALFFADPDGLKLEFVHWPGHG
jgi:phosphatidylethanolamine-binding protein (PEBP) family uncharacterized protein